LHIARKKILRHLGKKNPNKQLLLISSLGGKITLVMNPSSAWQDYTGDESKQVYIKSKGVFSSSLKNFHHIISDV
jgi:hypothetical protein